MCVCKCSSLIVSWAYEANYVCAVEVKCHYGMPIYIKAGTIVGDNSKSQGHTSLISPVPHSLQKAFLKMIEAETVSEQFYIL